MSLIEKLKEIKQMEIPFGISNIEIEAKFKNTQSVDKLIEHLISTNDIQDDPVVTETIDYFEYGKDTKYSKDLDSDNIYDVTKNSYFVVMNNNHKIKVSFERNIPVGPDTELKFDLSQVNKRLKQRYSYTIGKNYTLDVTLVNKTDVEVELEVINYSIIDEKQFLHYVQFIEDILTFYSYEDISDYINDIFADVCYFYNERVSTDAIINEYKNNITKNSILRSSNKGLNYMLISKPRDLQFVDLTFDGISLSKPYSASIKADGVQKIFIITNTGYWFLDPSNSTDNPLFYHSAFSINEVLTNSIFAGEFITIDKDVYSEHIKLLDDSIEDYINKASSVYLIFDTLVISSVSLVDMNYKNRYEFIQFVDMTDHDIVCMKKPVFFMDEDNDFFDVCNSALQTHRFYDEDGIILTPVNSGYIAAGQLNNTYLKSTNTLYRRRLSNYSDVCKWKPTEHLTIDFMFTYSSTGVKINNKYGNIISEDDVSIVFTVDNVIRNTTLEFVVYKHLKAKSARQNTVAEYYEDNIKPSENTIFVFGSNPEGRHGKGAAKIAVNQFGAKYGQGEGLQGNAYALPTKDLRVKENKGFKSIPPEQIIQSIKSLYKTANENPDKQFKVAYRNTTETSLNGYTGLEMIEMFNAAGNIPHNIIFSKEWFDTGKLNKSDDESLLSLSNKTNADIIIEPDKKYIIEFKYDEKFKSLFVRDDKKFENHMQQVMSVWNLIRNPISQDTITGKDVLLMRKYANKVKTYLLKDIKDYVLDVGFGKAGDATKYDKATKVIGIEPNTDYIDEAKSRLKSIVSEKFVILNDDFLKLKSETFDSIFENLPESMSGLTFTFSFMFSLTFFFEDYSLIKFAENIKQICNQLRLRGCTNIHFVYITLDGDKLINRIQSDSSHLDYNNIHINYMGANKISIIIKDSATVFNEQVEYFVRLNSLFNLIPFDNKPKYIRTDNVLLSKNEKNYMNMISMGTATYNDNTINVIKPFEKIHVTSDTYITLNGKKVAGNNEFHDDSIFSLSHLNTDSVKVKRVSTIDKNSVIHSALKALNDTYRAIDFEARLSIVDTVLKELNYKTKLNCIAMAFDISIVVIEGNIERHYGKNKNSWIYLHKTLGNEYEPLLLNDNYLESVYVKLNTIMLDALVVEFSDINDIPTGILDMYRIKSSSENLSVKQENKKMSALDKNKLKGSYSLTFGDAAKNHVNNQIIGELGPLGSGFKIKNLKDLQNYYKKMGKQVELIDLGRYEDDYVPQKHKGKVSKQFIRESQNKIVWKAAVLIIRNFIPSDEANALKELLSECEWDKKYWDNRRGKVLNKHARWNIVISEGNEQEPDYESAKGRIIDGTKLVKDEIQVYSNIKHRLVHEINEGTKTNKADNLICEGNYYYDMSKCGIGFYGDKERRKVICLSIGESRKLKWIWYKNNKAHDEFEIVLNNGDMYIMSEKAVGYDWNMSSIWSIRHSAGCDKYTTVKS